MHTLQPLDRSLEMTAPTDSSLVCTRLRDSCHSCARSKIKCPKEKPACSKCEARGIECQYFFAKRPGRRRENIGGHSHSCTSKNIDTSISESSNPTGNSNSNTDKEFQSDDHSGDGDIINISQQSGGPATNSTVPPTSLPTSLPEIDTPANLSTSASPIPNNIIGSYSSDVFSVIGDSGIFPQLPDFDLDVNEMDFVMPDPYPEPPVMGSDGVTHRSNDISLLLMPGNSDLGASDAMSASFAVSSSLSSGFQTPSTAKSNMMRTTTANKNNNPSCGCVAQALDLLKTLSSAQSPKFMSMDLSASGNEGFAQAVLVENKQNIEAVSSMLSCSSCTEDAFLLTILSMIVLKILERYANAARTQLYGPSALSVEPDTVPKLANSIISSSKEHMRALSRTYSSDDSASGRPPAQLVLGELHRVQRLVNQLSPKLKGPKEGADSNIELEVQARTSVAGTAPFSFNTLAQMEGDLRKSLSSLSADIINRLRQI